MGEAARKAAFKKAQEHPTSSRLRSRSRESRLNSENGTERGAFPKAGPTGWMGPISLAGPRGGEPQQQKQQQQPQSSNLAVSKNTGFEHMAMQFPGYGNPLSWLQKIRYARPVTAYDDGEGSYSYLYKPLPELGDGQPPVWQVADKLHDFLRDNIHWGRRNNNHDVAWYCAEGYECDYTFDSGDPHKPNTFPDFMLELRDHALEVMHLPLDNPPTSCWCNRYKNGIWLILFCLLCLGGGTKPS